MGHFFITTVHYPRQDDFSHVLHASVDLHNSGPVPALDVRVKDFNMQYHEENEQWPIALNLQSPVVPSQLSAPLLMRLGLQNRTSVSLLVCRIHMTYRDLDGDEYHLLMDIAMPHDGGDELVPAKPLRYSHQEDPYWPPLSTVAWRELGDRGYYDLDKMFQDKDSE